MLINNAAASSSFCLPFIDSAFWQLLWVGPWKKFCYETVVGGDWKKFCCGTLLGGS